MSDPADQVQNHGQYNTQHDGGGQREVERGVFATINDVPGQAADGQIGAA